jgi:hypothetical protein
MKMQKPKIQHKVLMAVCAAKKNVVVSAVGGGAYVVGSFATLACNILGMAVGHGGGTAI